MEFRAGQKAKVNWPRDLSDGMIVKIAYKNVGGGYFVILPEGTSFGHGGEMAIPGVKGWNVNPSRLILIPHPNDEEQK